MAATTDIDEWSLELFESLHAKEDESAYRTSDEIWEILQYTMLVWMVSWVVFVVVVQVAKEPKATDLKATYHAAFFVVTFLTNIYLTGMGMYYFFGSALPSRADTTVLERIRGQEIMSLRLGAPTLGTQFFALSVIPFLGESIDMVLHHFAAIVIASISSFSVNGFRFHNPFFFGVVELSSLPLGLMNLAKEHKPWMEANPGLYTTIRLIFCLCFLWTRVWLWLPEMTDFLHLAIRFRQACPALGCTLTWSAAVAGAFILTSLQLYWAYLIIMGIVKFSLKKKKNKPSQKDDKNADTATTEQNSQDKKDK